MIFKSTPAYRLQSFAFATASAEESRSAFYSWEIQAGTLRRVSKRPVGWQLGHRRGLIPGESMWVWELLGELLDKKWQKQIQLPRRWNVPCLMTSRVQGCPVLKFLWILRGNWSHLLVSISSPGAVSSEIRRLRHVQRPVSGPAPYHHWTFTALDALSSRPESHRWWKLAIRARRCPFMPGDHRGTATHMLHCRTMSDFWGTNHQKMGEKWSDSDWWLLMICSNE